MTAEVAGWTFDLYALGVLALAALGFYLLLRHATRGARHARVDRSWDNFARWGKRRFPG